MFLLDTVSKNSDKNSIEKKVESSDDLANRVTCIADKASKKPDYKEIISRVLKPNISYSSS